MNVFVADPEWGWWIILYFYCGGIAAGAYFLASLIELFGGEEDRGLARVGYWIALPLIVLCGVFLIVDLGRPERFWHMLFQSEVVEQAIAEGWPLSGPGWLLMLQAPLLKYWSPMSIGAWALTLFGLCSFLSFLGSLWPTGRLARLLRHGWFGRLFQLIGVGVGFFVASYTGVLLTASNQPLWSDSDWIGALFLTSAASTGIVVLQLIALKFGIGTEATRERLEQAELWPLGLELVIFEIFLASLGAALVPVLETGHGVVLVVGTLGLGLIVPLLLHLGVGATARWRAPAAALCALAGGFLMRYALLTTPPEILERGPGLLPEQAPAPLWDTWQGKTLVAGTVILALLLTLALSVRLGRSPRVVALVGAAFAVAVGVVLWYSVAAPVGPDGSQAAVWAGFSPEDGRPRGGGPGASDVNRPVKLQPRSKILGGEEHGP